MCSGKERIIANFRAVLVGITVDPMDVVEPLKVSETLLLIVNVPLST
jgi:hypothetical protein